LFHFRRHGDIKIALHPRYDHECNWSFTWNPGELYRGFYKPAAKRSRASRCLQHKPPHRLRVSYARMLETPFMKTGVASFGDPAASYLVLGTRLRPSSGHETNFMVGPAQGFLAITLVRDPTTCGRYTHNAYDSASLFTTPLRSQLRAPSKAVGFRFALASPTFHGLSRFRMLSGVTPFLHPQSRLGPDLTTAGSVPSIDHDQKVPADHHVQYQPLQNDPWSAFTGDTTGLGGGRVFPFGDGTNRSTGPSIARPTVRGGLCSALRPPPPKTPISPNGLCPANRNGSTFCRSCAWDPESRPNPAAYSRSLDTTSATKLSTGSLQ